MSNLPKVAIIVLNFNGYNLTKECLAELSKINYDNNMNFKRRIPKSHLSHIEL